MKSNEAPEKLWWSEGAVWHTNPNSQMYIEYIRKDAFIEKACEYLRIHRDEVETEDNGISGWIPDYFIEDFKNYMKGGVRYESKIQRS